jgi:membrane fusion protein, multidrug efflux system
MTGQNQNHLRLPRPFGRMLTVGCAILIGSAVLVAFGNPWGFGETSRRATRVFGWATSAGQNADSSVIHAKADEREATSVSDGTSVRGIVRAFETATLSAELNARILAVPFRDGDRFTAGDLLIKFDCAKLDADHDAAYASYMAHKLAYENQLELSRHQAAGSFAVAQSKYESEKAAAELAGLKARQDSCKIIAPFSGRVVERPANAHEVAQPNQPLMKIVNDGRLELVLMLPSSWLSSVRPGTAFSFKVDETGATHSAVVTQIGGAIEPVSQSVRVTGELLTKDALVLPGMSGTANLAIKEQAP